VKFNGEMKFKVKFYSTFYAEHSQDFSLLLRLTLTLKTNV